MADGTVKISTELDDSGFKSGLSKLGSVASTGLKATGVAIGAIAGAAGGAIAGLNNLVSATEEYRVAQGKLNTAFEAAGLGIDSAKTTYTEFYKILGDTDTATEASQLLAKLSLNQQDLSTWTNIAAGVYGTFGDALPIEGLIESANETAKVGQVTGTLADALNWAGISEDEFNAKLAACTSESERNQLIMDTLSGTYDEASEAFYRNNEALIQARENQALLDETLSTLAETFLVAKNNILSEFLPSISEVVNAFANMVAGVEGADVALSTAIQNLVSKAVEMLPQFLDFGLQILTAIGQGLLSNLPMVVSAAVQIVTTLLQGLLSSLPQILSAGLQAIATLIQGISQALPQLIPMAVQAITTIAQTLIANLPQIIQAGIQLLVALIEGITNAIPQLVAMLPTIIETTVSTLIANLPQIIQAGIQLLVALITGIIQAIPQLIAATPQIIAAIVKGIASGLSQIVNSGREIINSVGDGIKGLLSSALSWGRDIVSNIANGIRGAIGKVTSAVSAVASKIRSFLHFSEPDEGPLSDFHTYMPDMIDLMATGMRQNLGKVEKEAFSLADVIKKGLDSSDSIDFTADIPSIKQRMQSFLADVAPTFELSSPKSVVRSTEQESIIDELRSIRDAVKQGSVIQVDRQVLGRVTSQTNRQNVRAKGVGAY